MKNSFKYAIRGIIACVKSERNMRIHTAATFYVVLAGLITRISAGQWAAVLICCAAVMSAEMMNTSVEGLCDCMHPDWSEKIKFVKDVAAGAVLIFAVISAIVGIMIFFSGEQLKFALEFAKNETVLAALIVLTIPAAVYYVVGRKKNVK